MGESENLGGVQGVSGEENERSREEKRINNLYAVEDRELVSKLVLGVHYGSKGEMV